MTANEGFSVPPDEVVSVPDLSFCPGCGGWSDSALPDCPRCAPSAASKHGMKPAATTPDHSDTFSAVEQLQARHIVALEADNQRLRKALAEILVEASAYHGGLNRKTNALTSIVVRARDALDVNIESRRDGEAMSQTKGKGSFSVG